MPRRTAQVNPARSAAPPALEMRAPPAATPAPLPLRLSPPATLGAPDQERPAVLPTRVLIVDDEDQIREVLVDYLSLEGFSVTAVSNGADALAQLERDSGVDLVLSDLKMPGMGGLELASEIRQRGLDVVVVLMTGFATVETAVTAMQQGVHDYITKPFKVETVPQILRRALEQHQLGRENMQLRELLRLYQLSELLSSGQSIDQALHRVVDVVAGEFRADGVLLYSCRRDQGRCLLYELVAGRGKPVEHAARWAPAASWLEEHFEAELPVCCHDELARALFPDADADARAALTSFISVPLKVRGSITGMLNLYSFTPVVRFNERQRRALFMFASHAAAAVENARVNADLKRAFAQTIEGFARALEAKDQYTAGHSDRVATYAQVLARALQLDPATVDNVRHAALLHDIGKLGIRNEDLNKPQKLTQSEYVMFQSHPNIGARILQPLAFMQDLLAAVAYHHEQWDGSGYPEGRRGEDIPLLARVIAVADTYDAMTSDRAYRQALPHEFALEELRRCAGSQFDPRLVALFCDAIERWRDEQRQRGVPLPQ